MPLWRAVALLGALGVVAGCSVAQDVDDSVPPAPSEAVPQAWHDEAVAALQVCNDSVYEAIEDDKVSRTEIEAAFSDCATQLASVEASGIADADALVGHAALTAETIAAESDASPERLDELADQWTAAARAVLSMSTE